jgi:hypothetical protein
MPQLCDLARPVVRSAAGLHSNQAGWQLRQERERLPAPKLALYGCVSRRIDAVNSKQILCQVYTERSNIHFWTLPHFFFVMVHYHPGPL